MHQHDTLNNNNNLSKKPHSFVFKMVKLTGLYPKESKLESKVE